MHHATEKVKQMILEGKTHCAISFELKISRSTIYTIITGKKYKSIPIRGLSEEQRKVISNIAKNKSVSQSRLMLSYIRAGINAEPKQNLIYED